MWAAPTAAAALSLGWLYVYLRKKAQAEGLDNFLMLKREAADKFWEASISAVVQDVAQVVLAVKDFCQQNKRFGSREAYAAQLTVEELGVVIAEHSGLGKRAQIDILIRLLKERIIITVRDNGRAFNPVKYLDEHGKDFSGISMVRKLAVKMEYTSILGFNTTIVTIGKR
jgi:anti-sigma regulatory factor (Ser/Thr protein kinase)